jgi:hypothetical protein
MADPGSDLRRAARPVRPRLRRRAVLGSGTTWRVKTALVDVNVSNVVVLMFIPPSHGPLKIPSTPFGKAPMGLKLRNPVTEMNPGFGSGSNP